MSEPRADQKLPSWLPLVTGVVSTVLILAVAYNMAVQKTGGTLVYALDDAYIHLTMARNLHASGVWGMSPTVPASASSSPLWTLLLSLLDSLPIEPLVIPLLLNLLLAGLLVRQVYGLASFLNPWARAGIACLFVFALPGVAVFLGGMENLLHAFFTILFIGILVLVPRTEKSWKLLLTSGLIGLMMMLTRYESIFLFLIPAVWGVYRRQPLLVAPLVGGLLGVIAFGLASRAAGMPFVPNTILLKSDLGQANGIAGFFSSMLLRAQWNVEQAPTVAAVCGSGILVLISQWKSSPETRLAATAVIAATVMHIAFSFTRQLFRYEVYLVAAFGATILLGMRAKRQPTWARAAVALFGVALVYRGALAMIQSPEAVQNINDQQFQMATFLGKYYPGKSVALNDIGVVSYYSKVHVVDLYGLANDDVRKLKESGGFDTAAIADILNKNSVDACIVYYGWYQIYGGFPSEQDFPVVGQWTLQEPNVVCAWNHVEFVAPAPKAKMLQAALIDYHKQLPPSVKAQVFISRS
jgi:hypothetical protein